MNCPNCKSQNVKCYRKKQTDSQPVTDADIICICQDCGYKYKKVTRKRPAPSKGSSIISSGGEIQPKGVLKWFFIILLWPVALSVWFYNTNKIKIEKTVKAIIIALAWLVVTVVTAWLLFRPVYNIPEIVFDRTVTDKRDVSTAQFASTTAGQTASSVQNSQDATNVGEVADTSQSITAQTTTNSIFS